MIKITVVDPVDVEVVLQEQCIFLSKEKFLDFLIDLDLHLSEVVDLENEIKKVIEKHGYKEQSSKTNRASGGEPEKAEAKD